MVAKIQHFLTFGIISNEAYAGVWHWYGKNEHLTVKVPAIVSREVWKEAQKRKDENRRGGTRKYKDDALLRRRCICGECGYKMQVHTSSPQRREKYSYYFCPCYSDPSLIRQCSSKTRIRTIDLDTEVWKRVRRLFSDKDYLAQLINESSEKTGQKSVAVQAEIDTLAESIALREKELNDTATAFVAAEGKLQAVLQNRADELETIINELEERRKKRVNKLRQDQKSQEQLSTLQEWAEKLGRGLDKADNDFEIKKKFINILNVEVKVTIVNGEKKISVQCELGELYEQRDNFQ